MAGRYSFGEGPCVRAALNDEGESENATGTPRFAQVFWFW
jgi:hypothetical protein